MVDFFPDSMLASDDRTPALRFPSVDGESANIQQFGRLAGLRSTARGLGNASGEAAAATG
jgi:hypothetical protein